MVWAWHLIKTTLQGESTVLNFSHDISCLSECLCLRQSGKLTLQRSTRLISVFTYQAISLIEYMNMHNNPNEAMADHSLPTYEFKPAVRQQTSGALFSLSTCLQASSLCPCLLLCCMLGFLFSFSRYFYCEKKKNQKNKHTQKIKSISLWLQSS